VISVESSVGGGCVDGATVGLPLGNFDLSDAAASL
jgi:hypothetical protein